MAKKLVVPTTVTIYNPKGKPEQHTRANARDLVNGAGYTWEKKKSANPAGYAPFAIPQNTKFARSKAQEVLDRVATPKADADDGEGEVFEGVVEDTGSADPIVLPENDEDDFDGEGDEGEEAEAPAPVRKPRTPRKKPAPVAEPVEEVVEEIEEGE